MSMLNVTGRNAVKEYLKNIKEGQLFIQKNLNDNRILSIIKLAKSKGIEVAFCDRDNLTEISGSKSHQGVVLKVDDEYDFVIDERSFYDEVSNLPDEKSLILILDGIQDTGNLGAIIRTSVLLGVKYIVLPKDRTVSINEQVIKASAGASVYIKIVYVTNISRAIDVVKQNGFWVYAFDMGGKSLETFEFNKKSVFIFGGEQNGIRPLTLKNSDEIISIENTGLIDSFNISCSVAIALYSFYRL